MLAMSADHSREGGGGRVIPIYRWGNLGFKTHGLSASHLRPPGGSGKEKANPALKHPKTVSDPRGGTGYLGAVCSADSALQHGLWLDLLSDCQTAHGHGFCFHGLEGHERNT